MRQYIQTASEVTVHHKMEAVGQTRYRDTNCDRLIDRRTDCTVTAAGQLAGRGTMNKYEGGHSGLATASLSGTGTVIVALAISALASLRIPSQTAGLEQCTIISDFYAIATHTKLFVWGLFQL